MTAPRRWHLCDRELTLDPRPLVMGIVNVTPDSFSDGGLHATTESAVAHALRLVEDGADLLDVGGESTRPGSTPVPVEEELARVVPVVLALAARTAVPLSIDTSKAEVARQCLRRGAKIINDVTALRGDPEMAAVVREHRAGVVLMHMQGTPATMQLAPHYDDVVEDIAHFFEERLQWAAGQGIEAEQLALDPGIGFGKTFEHNLELLARLGRFQKFGRPVCLGVSRKGFLGRLLDRPVEQRLAGSLAVVCDAVARDAVQVVRVHDVRATRDVVTLLATLNAFREKPQNAAPADG
jgi:dihydropteroate synthase